MSQYVPAADTSTLRITGYGVDDTPPGSGGGRNSDNETEQTSTGPYRGQTDDGIRVYHSYSTDSEPANSGSPMMYLSSGNYFSLGIHTLAGCDTNPHPAPLRTTRGTGTSWSPWAGTTRARTRRR